MESYTDLLQSLNHRFSHLLHSRMAQRVSLVCAFALVGTALVMSTRAATPSAGVEAESGTMSGASIVSSTGASGGSAVKFGDGSGAEFRIGVWLQGPAGEVPGYASNAAFYKSLGVTTFLGLWQWPSDEDKYPGWAQSSLNELAQQNMNAYAGDNVAAIQTTLGMPNQSVITGWLAGDEPDMFGPEPPAWNENISALKAAANRPVAGNFGKGFAGFGWWYDHISDADRASWCSQIDMPSVDYYGMTDHWEPAENKGAWTYGRAIDNLRKACGDQKPLGAFVETTEIGDTDPAITPDQIKAAAWNAIIHGADVLNWFVHDFNCNPECGDSAFATSSKWAANRQAVSEVNGALHQYAAVLATPDITGSEKATASGLPLHLLTKKYNGKNYVFAQSAGDSSSPGGYSGQATVSINGKNYTDSWTLNQVRIYQN